MRPAVRWIVVVLLAMRQRENLFCGSRDLGGGFGKFALVLIIHGHRVADNVERLDARHPGEVRVGQQAVVALQRRQVVTVGIAVALWEHALGVGGIDAAVRRAATDLFLDVVVRGIQRLTTIDATRVVPEQAIVKGRLRHLRIEKIVASAQQGEFLRQ